MAIQHIHHLETLTLYDRFLKIVFQNDDGWKKTASGKSNFGCIPSNLTDDEVHGVEGKPSYFIESDGSFSSCSEKHLQDERKTSTKKSRYKKTNRKSSH